MSISIENRQNKFKIDRRRLLKSLKRLMRELCCQDGELSLLLVDDDQIRVFNRTYLKRDRSTNVISFSMREGEFSDINPQLLGDIILSLETAYRDAVTGNIDFMDEVEFLVIHGLLHLLGYEHENATAKESRQMKTRERELFFLLRHYE
ncbi:MAG: rRNA maturation RNase YbeY, partial [Syntrophus sp. (in: bacteria)]|nr:rRNA maturation RNase YbeY [Syntrophus sp. (in: bacteria)]